MPHIFSRLALGTLIAAATLPLSAIPAAAQSGSQFHGHHALPPAAARPVAVATTLPATVGSRVDVQLDRTSVVRLPSSASAVVVGNPDIADIAVHSTDTLLVLGRSYGRTNILAMDAAGRIISDTDVHVGARRGTGSVRVYSGADTRRTYSCEPDCLPAPELGDSPEHIGAFRPAAPQINDQFVSQGGLGAPMTSMQPPMTGMMPPEAMPQPGFGAQGLPAPSMPAPMPSPMNSPMGSPMSPPMGSPMPSSMSMPPPGPGFGGMSPSFERSAPRR